MYIPHMKCLPMALNGPRALTNEQLLVSGFNHPEVKVKHIWNHHLVPHVYKYMVYLYIYAAPIYDGALYNVPYIYEYQVYTPMRTVEAHLWELKRD